MVDFLADKGRVADSWWRETVLLLVGYLGLKSQEAALTLVRQLAVLDASPVASLAGVELAGVGLLELDSHDAPAQSLIVRRLVEGVANPNLALSPPLRAAAGVALGRLGDPRHGVGVQDGRPVIDWIEIEPGPFLMGSAKGEERYPDELPQFTCNLIRQPYRISRFPVTVLQYGAFVDADGYGQQRFWTRAGWQWRQKEGITGPRAFGGVYQTANHPQVGVSWYEAVAFCAWLTQQLGFDVTLPSEAQWERAARHTDGRTYPWGRSGDSYQYCNGVKSGIGATSAVGGFPQGNAVCGAADMVGNVWEWCCTKWLSNYEGYESKVDNNLEGTERRVLRGGSFPSENNLRCAARGGYNPYYRNDTVGFRVCASP
jgi:formylglycine-generating enzyme required for sulfatase activity